MQKKCTLLFKSSYLLTAFISSSNFLSAQKINSVTAVNISVTNVRPFYGLTVDEENNLLLTQYESQDVIKLTPDNWGIIAGLPYEEGYTGDGNLATNASFSYPTSITTDKKHNVYVIDQFNNAIRCIGQDGKVRTIVGQEGAGFSGDGGLALNAQINYPTGIATDSKGNLYIADDGNNRIRKIDTSGIITTFAGTGQANFFGENTPAIQAHLTVNSLAFDKNNQLYFTDIYNNRIRKIDTNGIISTYAGNGANSAACPLIVNDTASALQTSIGSPSQICVDDENNVFFISNDCSLLYADGNSKLHFVLSSRDIGALAYRKGFVYYNLNNEDLCYFQFVSIYKYNVKKHESIPVYCSYCPTKLANKSNNIYSGTSKLPSPNGIYFYKNNIFFTDKYKRQVKKIDDNGILTVIAGDGVKGTNGYGDGGNALVARFNEPKGLASDNNGNIFVADYYDNRIRKINRQNIISTLSKISSPNDVAIDNNGNILVSSADGNIYKIYSNGNKVIYAAGFSLPEGIAFDKHSDLYVAEYNASKIKKVDTSGNVIVFAGTGTTGFDGDNGNAISAKLHYPKGVGVDDSGNVFIADEYNNRIRKVDNAGIITTIAGGGLGESYACDGDVLNYGSFSGDDDTATKANLNAPGDITLNAKNNLFFIDAYNSVIREVQFNCIKKPIPFSYGISTYVNRSMQLNLDCNLLCNISPTQNYLTALNDFIISNVWLEKTVITDSSKKPFVSRHYQVYPVADSNYNTTTGITLYFTQAEFNGYNNKATGYLKLPASSNDTNAIKNLMIYFYKSKSFDSSGLPNSYHTSATTINPRNENIIWNNIGKYWEVTFNVSSLGGFFIGTKKINSSMANAEVKIKEEGIKVYPNPANDKLYITLPENLLYKPIILSDAEGKQISIKTANAENVYFDLNNLAAGIYYLKFEDGTVKKIVHVK